MPKCFQQSIFNKDNTSQNPSTSTNPVLKSKKLRQTDECLNGYQFEVIRLESFKNVPCLLPQKFASAGFYHTGVDDEMKCSECETIIRNWQLNCNLMARHESKCSFFHDISSSVPIDENPEMISTANESRTGDILRCNDDDCRRVYNPTELPRPVSTRSSKYDTYDDRLNSYANWPKHLLCLKEQLAAAGLFYTGNGDNTKCFACRAEMTCWTVDDDPWEDHAKYSRMCHYLFMTKGKKYVDNIIIKTYSTGLISRSTCTSDDQTKDSDTPIASGSSQGVTESTGIADSNKKRKSSDISFSTADEQTKDSDTPIASGSSQGVTESTEIADSNKKRKSSDISFSTADEQNKNSDTSIASGSSQGITESIGIAENNKKRNSSDISFSAVDEETEDSDTFIASESSQGITERNKKRNSSDTSFSTGDELIEDSDSIKIGGSDKKRKSYNTLISNAISAISFSNDDKEIEIVILSLSLFLILIYFLYFYIIFDFVSFLPKSSNHY